MGQSIARKSEEGVIQHSVWTGGRVEAVLLAITSKYPSDCHYIAAILKRNSPGLDHAGDGTEKRVGGSARLLTSLLP